MKSESRTPTCLADWPSTCHLIYTTTRPTISDWQTYVTSVCVHDDVRVSSLLATCETSRLSISRHVAVEPKRIRVLWNWTVLTANFVRPC